MITLFTNGINIEIDRGNKKTKNILLKNKNSKGLNKKTATKTIAKYINNIK
jgi:hypothetical protein